MPLSEDQKRQIIGIGLQKNQPREVILEALRRAEVQSNKISPPGEADFRQAYMELVPSQEKQRERERQAEAMAIGGAMGGAGAEAAFGPYVGKAAAATLGEFTGTVVGGKTTGVPTQEAMKIGALAGTAGLVTRGVGHGLTWLTSKGAGIPSDALAAARQNPELVNPPRTVNPDGSIVNSVDQNAELSLARQLHENTKIQAGETTPHHEAYQLMLGPRINDRVDATPIVDTFQKYISGADVPEKATADKAISRMAQKFIDRIGPDNKISLGDLDNYIRENMTDPLHGSYTSGRESEFYGRLKNIRGELTDYLYGSIDKQAAPAQEMASRSLNSREAVENTFRMGTDARPSAAGIEKIRSIRANTGESQLNRDLLARYDAEHGTNFLNKAKNLSIRRDWNFTAQQEAAAIDAVFQPTRPGLVKGVSLPLTKLGLRATPMAGYTAAGGAAYLAPRDNP